MRLAEDVLVGKLEAVQGDLERRFGPLRTLHPRRAHATPLGELGERICDLEEDPATLAAYGETIVSIVESQVQHFPDNIFWDLDYLAASLFRQAKVSSLGPVAYLVQATEMLVALHGLYGVHSAIRFRYVHDFLYGFDWARWVRRDSEERGHVGPFDLEFLEHSRQRGHELLQLIAEEDGKYPPLPAGEMRNPFRFSREPSEEIKLHRDLAQVGMVPVFSWKMDAAPRWDEPFSAYRDRRAEELGLAT